MLPTPHLSDAPLLLPRCGGLEYGKTRTPLDAAACRQGEPNRKKKGGGRLSVLPMEANRFLVGRGWELSNGIAGAAVRATHAQTPDGAFLAASLPRRRRLGVRALGWLTVTGRALRDGFEAAGSARLGSSGGTCPAV